MVIITQDMIQEFQKMIDEIDGPLKITFETMHQGYPRENLCRFLKARDENIPKAHTMLLDCLNWRMQNEIDDILAKPIVPEDVYRAVRDSQLVGMSGYSKEGLPVVAVGVGLSTYDKASIHYYVQSHIQMNEYRDRVILILTAISTIDDLNYPEKTDTYYIVNAPYIFSACWKVVRPLLQERTRKKIQVLQGCGRDELLKIIDYASLPHFCRREASGSSRHSRTEKDDNCFSLDNSFHQQLYEFVKKQAELKEHVAPVKQGSFHVDFPEPAPNDAKIAETIQSEFQKLGDQNGLGSLVIKGH